MGLALMLSTVGVSAGSAQDGLDHIRMVQVFESDRTGLSNPAGLAFSPQNNTFQVVESPGQGLTLSSETDVIQLSPFGERVASSRVAAQVGDPINIAFDDQTDHLFILRSPADRLFGIVQNADGDLDSKTLDQYDALRFGLQDPQGMAFDPASGGLFILDTVGPRLIRVQPGTGGNYASGVISSVDLGGTGLSDVRGLAFDPTTGHLHLLSDQKLVELTQSGQVVAARDLSEFNLSDPQGMVFAPSGDQTDDPSQLSLYLADQGSGQIVEFSLAAPLVPAAASFQSSLIRTTDLSAISPPSPDPSGLAYLPSRNTLVMDDGEVEETVNGITHFAGANVWELKLDGSLVRTANISKITPTVFPLTNEPTGVAWIPANGQYIFSADDGKEIYIVNPGADQWVGTADDRFRHFDTLVHGSGDPEGITFDTSNKHLFVADGTNREVYEYTLSGSLVDHFDVQAYGVEDPESVEFNPESGTLFIMSSDRSTPVIAETTTSGVLLRTIDISVTNARAAAGLAIAPASDGSGAERFYIVDRGVDNNTDPNIVDGKMYELTTPSSGANNPPVAKDDSISTPQGNAVNINVAANDSDPDGNLAPASANTDCAACTKPARGNLEDNGNGTFTYTPNPGFTGSDGFIYQICDSTSLCDTASVSISVNTVAAANFRFSMTLNATAGGVSAADEDIVAFNGTSFSLFFDGSDVGVGALDLDGFYVVDSDTILMSFNNPATIGPLGTIDDSDIVKFDATSLGPNTAGSFSLYFDGSDVGLDADGEDIDAMDVLPDGRLLISSVGGISVPGVTGADEDLLAFTPTALGSVTSGTWAMYFDGSDIGLSTTNGEDVDGVSVTGVGDIYLSTYDVFAVTGVSGADEDVFICSPASLGSSTACTFSPTLYFDGSLWGLAGNDLDAIDLP